METITFSEILHTFDIQSTKLDSSGLNTSTK